MDDLEVDFFRAVAYMQGRQQQSLADGAPWPGGALAFARYHHGRRARGMNTTLAMSFDEWVMCDRPGMIMNPK